MLILCQLESDPSNFMEIRQPSFFSCASQRIRLAVVKLGELLSYVKGYPDGWFRHTCLCFLEGLYSVDENVNVVLSRHFDFFL